MNNTNDVNRSNLFWSAFANLMVASTPDIASGLTDEGKSLFFKRLSGLCPTNKTPSDYSMNATLCIFVNMCLGEENREGHRKWVNEEMRKRWYATSDQIEGKAYSFETGTFVFTA